MYYLKHRNNSGTFKSFDSVNSSHHAQGFLGGVITSIVVAGVVALTTSAVKKKNKRKRYLYLLEGDINDLKRQKKTW